MHQEGEGQDSKFQNSSKNTFRSYELKGLSKISICMEEGWGLFFHVRSFTIGPSVYKMEHMFQMKCYTYLLTKVNLSTIFLKKSWLNLRLCYEIWKRSMNNEYVIVNIKWHLWKYDSPLEGSGGGQLCTSLIYSTKKSLMLENWNTLSSLWHVDSGLLQLKPFLVFIVCILEYRRVLSILKKMSAAQCVRCKVGKKSSPALYEVADLEDWGSKRAQFQS